MKFFQSFCPPAGLSALKNVCVKQARVRVSVCLDGRIYRLWFASEGPTRVLMLLLLVQTWVNRMRSETSQNVIWLLGKDQAHFTFISHFNFNNIFWDVICLNGFDCFLMQFTLVQKFGVSMLFYLGGNGNNLQ